MSSSPTVVAPASLYVGDLHREVTDKDLYEAFSCIDGLVSVRVCCDSLTRQSLSYGYVNYITHADAARAMELLNHTRIKGKSIRIMWTEKDPTARKNGLGNLFVKNLQKSIDNVMLKEIFGKYGNILSCKVAADQLGKSKGYGFVQFDAEESANNAIQNLNGAMIEGKQLFVGPFVRRTERKNTSLDDNYTNLYMKNLDAEVVEETLKELFSEFGKVTNLIIMKEDDGTSKGFGFVNFSDHGDAKCAVEGMNGKLVGTKPLYVARAQKKAEREEILHHEYDKMRKEKIMKSQGSNLYVKNIDDAVDEDALQEYFSKCGMVTSVKLMRDDNGVSKGFGFVCFSCPEEANKAISNLHGNLYHGKPLYVGIAQKKEVRQAQLSLHYAQGMGGFAGPALPIIPSGYPPLNFYTPPPTSGVIQQHPSKPGVGYQPLGLRPGWRPKVIPQGPHTTRPGLQQLPTTTGKNNQKHFKQNKGHANGLWAPYSSQSETSIQNTQPTEFTNHQGIQPNQEKDHAGHGASSSSAAPTAKAMEVMTSLLSAANSPEHQKKILGNRLFPLVKKLQTGLVGKITDMLLEMDNSELLRLLESPEALAAKVDEAARMLNPSKTGNTGKEEVPPHSSSLLSAVVTVN